MAMMLSVTRGSAPKPPAGNCLVLIRAGPPGKGQPPLPLAGDYYKRCFPGGCTQSVLEGHGGGGATHCERRHRLVPGYKEQQNARATDN